MNQQIQAATLAVRKRLNEPMISVSVKQARFNIHKLRFTKRSSVIEKVYADDLTADQAVEFLNAMTSA